MGTVSVLSASSGPEGHIVHMSDGADAKKIVISELSGDWKVVVSTDSVGFMDRQMSGSLTKLE